MREAGHDRAAFLAVSGLGERALGFFHIGTGLWLFYLYAGILNAVPGYKLWL